MTDYSIKETDSHNAGGCNLCQRHMTANGREKHQVCEIIIHRSSVRMCAECLDDFRWSFIHDLKAFNFQEE